MDTPIYSQLGTKIAVGGIVAWVLSHFVGVQINPDMISKTLNDILTVGGEIATIYGIIHQAVKHKSLAVTTGVIK